mgnify:CR=1 FL=1
MKLVLCQLDSQWEATGLNLKSFSAAVDAYVAAYGTPDIFVFPEFFPTAFTFNLDYAESEGGPALQAMKAKAAQTGCAMAGSMLVADGSKAVNRFYFVTESGDVYRYDKRHAFSISGENEAISCGRERVVLSYRGWNIALSVCYDLRFPVWMRNDDNCYDLMINVASWPASRITYAAAMLRSRAIENMCYMAFCNRVGRDPECEYNGQSDVLDYGGVSLARQRYVQGFSFVAAEIHRAPLLEYREDFPIWKDSDKYTIEL